MFDIRQLRYFLEVCHSGSIAQAAKALHIAQPALSRQMRSLEQALGAPLLVRLPRGVGLTRAGEALREQAADIVARSQAIPAQVRVATSGLSGSLKVGVIPGYSWLPGLAQTITMLQQTAPHVRVQVEPEFSADQLTRLARQELDVGIVAWRSPMDARFTGQPIFTDRMVLALPKAAPLAKRRGRLFLKDLEHEPMLMFARDRSPAHHDTLVQAFARAGMVLRSASLSVFDMPTLVGMVAAGLGCAVVPQSFQQQWGSQVAFRELADLDIAFGLELVRLTQRQDPLVARFWDLWDTLAG